MSWFYYGEYERRSHRKGVALRVRDLPKPIIDQAKKLMERSEFIDYVVVEELKKAPDVLLAVHVRKPGAFANAKGYREGVIHFTWPEDPKWICEGDLGRGCVEGKKDS